MIRSQKVSELSRCAMIIIVSSLWVSDNSCNAALISCSVLLSRAEVASSKNSTSASLYNARAIPIRCFCPPESRLPNSPNDVSIPSGNSEAQSFNCTCSSTRSIFSLTTGFPSAIFSASEPCMMKISCGTYPTNRCHWRRL